MAAAQRKLVSKTLRYSLYNHFSSGKKGNFSNLSVFLQYAYSSVLKYRLQKLHLNFSG